MLGLILLLQVVVVAAQELAAAAALEAYLQAAQALCRVRFTLLLLAVVAQQPQLDLRHQLRDLQLQMAVAAVLRLRGLLRLRDLAVALAAEVRLATPREQAALEVLELQAKDLLVALDGITPFPSIQLVAVAAAQVLLGLTQAWELRAMVVLALPQP